MITYAGAFLRSELEGNVARTASESKRRTAKRQGQGRKKVRPVGAKYPQLRKFSQEKLKRVLHSHEEWLKTERKKGERANLSRVDLRGASLQKVRLERANLEGADLRGANLDGANVAGANLSGANFNGNNLSHVIGLQNAQKLDHADFEDAKGLLGTEFAQADVTGATLPKDIREFNVLQVIEETSKNARKIFLSMLLGCGLLRAQR